MATKRVIKKVPKGKKERIAPITSQAKQKTSLFPRIYRFITESWKLLLVSFASGVLLTAIILQSISLYQSFQEYKKLKGDRDKTVAELNHWKQIAVKYKNYRDAYFKLASLEYSLGNIEEAKINLRKTLELDPNFEKAREMEKIL